MRRLIRAFAVQGLVVAGLLGGGLAVHAYRTQPRPARTLVERELHGGILAPGEEVRRVVTVFRRRPSDYMRATRGILALTDRRLVYVGLAPRDILGSGETPPVFESRDFAPDTTLGLRAGRTLLGAAHALVLERRGERHVLGVRDDEWQTARAIVADVQARQVVQRGEATRIERARVAADSVARAPRWHVVQRGEAVSTIANMYGTTPEVIRELNALTGDRIRVGQRLLVKPQT